MAEGFPRAGNLGQLIHSILDRRFRRMFPRHLLVFKGLMPYKCDRGVLGISFFEVLKSTPRFSAIGPLSTT